MNDNYIVFGAPELTQDDLDCVMETFKSGWIGTGPKAGLLEETFCEYIGSKYAVALSSCTAALHLALLASGLYPGDEVITTPMTFCSTANAIIHAQAKPIFADIDPITGLIDPTDVERKITKKTRAVLPVHLAGKPCDLDSLSDLVRERGIHLIEDCAHSIETLRRGKHTGTVGRIGCFSFYVTKNVTGIEGGMLVTDEENIASAAKILAGNGLDRDAWKRFSDEGYKHYEAVSAGYKYNLPDVHAALVLSQLARVETNLLKRESIWKQYNQAFSTLPCVTPSESNAGERDGLHLYRLLLNLDELSISRDMFMKEMHQRGIGTGVHYLSLHLHKYYRERYQIQPNGLPNSLWHAERTVSLPSSPAMSNHDVERVIKATQEILTQNKR